MAAAVAAAEVLRLRLQATGLRRGACAWTTGPSLGRPSLCHRRETQTSSWLEGSSSNDYPGYDKIIEQLAKETADTQIEKSAALVGSPEKLIEQIKSYQDSTGGFDIASLQVSFSDLPLQVAEDSMRLFAEEVIPYV